MKKWIVTVNEILEFKDGRCVYHTYHRTVYANNWDIAQQQVRMAVESRSVSIALRAKVNEVRKVGEVITPDIIEKDGFYIQILPYAKDFFDNFKVGKKQIKLNRILRVRPYINYFYCKTSVWTSLILKENERRKIRIAFEKRLQSSKK